MSLVRCCTPYYLSIYLVHVDAGGVSVPGRIPAEGSKHPHGRLSSILEDDWKESTKGFKPHLDHFEGDPKIHFGRLTDWPDHRSVYSVDVIEMIEMIVSFLVLGIYVIVRGIRNSTSIRTSSDP